MWSYYGAKTNLIDYYPAPKHDKIIEPFAGSARYSLRYFEKDILLIDKYPTIIKIWKWLQSCSEKDVLSLPRKMEFGQTLNDFAFDCEEAKLFMGFIIGCGAERPRIKATERKTTMRPNHINYNLKRVAANLYKIRHWEFLESDYSAALLCFDCHYKWQFGNMKSMPIYNEDKILRLKELDRSLGKSIKMKI